MKNQNNYAFIDGQNLHLGTRSDGWEVDLVRFRIYLDRKYQVSVAYYFLGCISDNNSDLYFQIQKSGFILIFREHSSVLIGKKKGNVDADVVFEMMRHYIDEKEMGKVILVSGDGDYKKVVDFLIKKNKFLKILFPNKKHSSLYKPLSNQYGILLSHPDIRKKVSVNEKGALGS